jgi:protein TIF31
LEDSVECADENGKVWNISGGLEVKGILGSDKRKYVLDTMRLSPRDVNYPGMDNNCCVLRLELIENYIMS